MSARADRVYRCLLRLLPAAFRAEAEPELVETFRLGYARARHQGVAARFAFWLRISADTLVTAFAERVDGTAHDPLVIPEEPPMRRFTALRSCLRDGAHALRVFRRAPLFYVGMMLTLAVGIGANGAVFSILQAVLLQPLPYDHAKDVVMVWRGPEHPPAGPAGILQPSTSRHVMTPEMVLDTRKEAGDVLGDVATYISWVGNLEAQFDLGLADHAERLRGALATPNFFDLLGVKAARGRLFSAADEQSTEPLIVLSDALWRRAFGADPAVVGRPLTLVTGRSPRGPRTFTVIGVLPPAFRFTYPQETEAWVMNPWSAVESYCKGCIGFWTVARLRADVPLQRAQARVAAIRSSLDRPNQRPEDREIFRLEPIYEWVVSDARPELLLLGGVALLLLLLTCSTVATALFVRVTERHRELAVRASLGAGRGRLVGQLLTEGAVLSVAGTTLGLLLASLMQPVLRAVVPQVLPRADDIHLNGWILAYAALAAAVTTMLAGVAPAWRGSRVDIVSMLKRAAGSVSADRTTARWRQSLVAFQAAVASLLLVSAVLLLASFWRLGQVPLGFDGNRVITVEMRLLDMKYRQPGAVARFQDDLIAHLRGVPGVIDAGLTSAVPFRGVDFVMVIDRVNGTKTVPSNGRYVDPGYFTVMRMPAVNGRLFTDADGPSSPKVIVVSEAYARQMFGGENPIGQMIDSERPKQVIGVVPDVRYKGLDQEPFPAIYFPRAQYPNELICAVLRTAPNAGDVAPAIRATLHDLDPALPAMNMTTIGQIIDESVADRRFFTTATSAFAAVALLLTAIGLAVVVARAVVERRREMAIRAALGAQTSQLMALAMGHGLAPVVAGAGVGLSVALIGSRLLTQFLFGVTPRAPWAYALVGALVIVVGAAACLIPARRVTDASPASLLRAE